MDKRLDEPKDKGMNIRERMIEAFDSRSGATLIEILAVLAVVAVIMTPLAGTFTTGYRAFHREDENVKVTRCARTAMERVVEAVRKADSVKKELVEGEEKEYVYDMVYDAANTEISWIRAGEETLDSVYAFDGIDGAQDLEEKEVKFIVFESQPGRPARVNINVRVEGIRTGEYELSTDVYMRSN